MQKGSGWRKPKDHDEVLLSLKAEATDGSLIEERPSFDYVIGSQALGLLGKACDKALQGMLKNERASIKCTREYAYGDVSPEGAVVVLELREIYDVSDVSFTEDKSMMKKQVREGEDYQTPEDCAMVKLAVTAATDGSAPLPGFVPKTLEFSVGDGEVCDALECAVAKMKKGEKALLTVSDTSLAEEAQLGLKGLVADQVVFSLELIGCEPAKFVWEMSEEERLEFGKARKDKGSELFKAGRFQMAFQRYEMVYEWVNTPKDYEEENREIANQLKIAIELNKAAVYMKLEKFTEAKIEAETVLESDPWNAKANYRLAQVEIISENFLEAIQLCQKIIERDARNSDARALLKQAQALQKGVDKKANAMFANMSKAIGKGPVREPYRDKTMLLADEIDAEDTDAPEGDE